VYIDRRSRIDADPLLECVDVGEICGRAAFEFCELLRITACVFGLLVGRKRVGKPVRRNPESVETILEGLLVVLLEGLKRRVVLRLEARKQGFARPA